ncbi:MAG TPA: hypothetical protein VF202_10025, partial [Trueperaceae bacterium]
EPDVVTIWDLDWDRSDEELARLIGRDPAVVAEFRRRVFGGNGHARRVDNPSPELLALWREEASTHTLAELAALWGLTVEGARLRAKRFDLTPAKRGGPRKGRKRVATIEAVEGWRREAALHTADELARMWGVAEQTVFTRAWRHGFTVRARGRGTPERVVERWRRQARGRTIAELAALWGVPRGTAWGRARRHGLPVRRREPRAQPRAQPQSRAKPRRDVERMRREAEGRTVKELAMLWGVSRQRAHQLVTRHGLPAKVRRRKTG